MLDIQQLRVIRGRTSVLQNINCAIESGKLIVLIGENGAGKSTLLHAIAGNIHYQGNIHYGDQEIRQWRCEELARYRAVLSQQSQFNFQFSVPELIAMGRYPLTESKAQQQQRVADFIRLLDLETLAERNTEQLSGGQLQRVNMARCLAQLDAFSEFASGKLLLLDEPTSALDMRHQHRLMQIVQRFVAEGNTAIVAIHDLNLASLYADEVLLLSQGRLIKHGEKAQVLSQKFLEPVYQSHMFIHHHPRLNTPIIFSQPKETRHENSSTN